MVYSIHELVTAIRIREAEIAVGASTARGQGASGVVQALRDALAQVPLERFSVSNERAFKRQLERQTQVIMTKVPPPASSWGLARKCMNIYLRDCFYNHYLRKHYRLSVSEKYFEIPLDSYVAQGIRSRKMKDQLPRWPGVKHLTPDISTKYQEAAREISKSWRIQRVHLDTFLFVEGRHKKSNGR